MKIARSHIAKAVEGALTTKKRFVYKSKNWIYFAYPWGKTKDGVTVNWMPRYRKVYAGRTK